MAQDQFGAYAGSVTVRMATSELAEGLAWEAKKYDSGNRGTMKVLGAESNDRDVTMTVEYGPVAGGANYDLNRFVLGLAEKLTPALIESVDFEGSWKREPRTETGEATF